MWMYRLAANLGRGGRLTPPIKGTSVMERKPAKSGAEHHVHVHIHHHHAGEAKGAKKETKEKKPAERARRKEDAKK